MKRYLRQPPRYAGVLYGRQLYDVTHVLRTVVYALVYVVFLFFQGRYAAEVASEIASCDF